MATEEHKYLADIIKKTHATLRKEAQNHGPEIAWQRHVTRKEILQEYAVSMQKLATTCWMENNLNSKDGTRCRVEWIKVQCKEYFLHGGKEKYNEREALIRRKIETKDNAAMEENQAMSDVIDNLRKLSPIQKISLLDVGSCYNPFETEELFNVTAIDLNGIPDKVLQCDFLNVKIGKERVFVNNDREVLELPENSFDVVVFSLLLEYLPCPKQRYVCCKKAYDLLQVGGILCVVSPDSKHVHANAKFMKSWRYVLSKLGFMRIKYEKLQHIHCIIFRKCIFKDVAIRWADMQLPTLPKNDPLFSTEAAIYIPQDFQDLSNECEQQKREEYDLDELSCMFNELPFESV